MSQQPTRPPVPPPGPGTLAWLMNRQQEILRQRDQRAQSPHGSTTTGVPKAQSLPTVAVQPPVQLPPRGASLPSTTAPSTLLTLLQAPPAPTVQQPQKFPRMRSRRIADSTLAEMDAITNHR